MKILENMNQQLNEKTGSVPGIKQCWATQVEPEFKKRCLEKGWEWERIEYKINPNTNDGLWSVKDEEFKKWIAPKTPGVERTRKVLYYVDGEKQTPETFSTHLSKGSLSKRDAAKRRSERNLIGVTRTRQKEKKYGTIPWEEFKLKIDKKFFKDWNRVKLHNNEMYAGYWRSNGTTPWEPLTGRYNKKRDELQKKGEKTNKKKYVVFINDDTGEEYPVMVSGNSMSYQQSKNHLADKKAMGRKKVEELCQEKHGDKNYEYTFIPKYARATSSTVNKENSKLRYICHEHGHERFGEITQTIQGHAVEGHGCPNCAKLTLVEPVCAYESINGKYKNEYDNVQEAGEKLNIDYKKILSVLSTERYSVSGYTFKFQKDADGKNDLSAKDIVTKKESLGEHAITNALLNKFKDKYTEYVKKEEPFDINSLSADKKLPDTGRNKRMDFIVLMPKFNVFIEYHGQQHYKKVKYWHKTNAKFQEQKYKDHLRRVISKIGMNGKITHHLEIGYKEKIKDIPLIIKSFFTEIDTKTNNPKKEKETKDPDNLDYKERIVRHWRGNYHQSVKRSKERGTGLIESMMREVK